MDYCHYYRGQNTRSPHIEAVKAEKALERTFACFASFRLKKVSLDIIILSKFCQYL